MVESPREPRDLKVDHVPGEDKKIMECLGAAVVMRWGTLPTKIKREIFHHATSLADLAQPVPWSGKIARFLHHTCIIRATAIRR